MKNLPKIFIVEDDAFYATLLKNEIVKNRLGEVESFLSGEHFMENLFKIPDIVLLDYDLGSTKGIDILKKIKSINPNIQVIFLSAQEKLQVAITSLKYGAYDYVEKNDSSFPRIKALIKRISKFNEMVEEQKQFKMAKIVFGALILAVVSVAIYLELYYSSIFF
jgi:DNA-binding NtrC family response regulator